MEEKRDGFVEGAASAGGLSGVAAGAAVRYEDFGAKGDGVADDFDAIIAAHAYANAHGLPVRVDDGATYYIGRGSRTADIATDTDFGTASFIIDDAKVPLEDRQSPIFCIRASRPSFHPEGLATLKVGQSHLGIQLPSACVIVVVDDGVRQFIRRGLNRNKGSAKTDVLLVAADGTIDPATPPIWDFDAITRATAYPVDATPLTLRGGRFTTIANQATPDSPHFGYFGRGMLIERSNVRVEGLEHRVVGEGETGAPYSGFVRIVRCAHVELRNVVFSAHKTYRKRGVTGELVSMGTYDLTMEQAVYVSLVGCTQANDIDDDRLWGVMGSNFCKNMVYEDCVLSRFDAHQGLYNGAIRRSRVRLVNLIGGGTFRIEDSVITGPRLIHLRDDYGSTWNGDIVVRNTTFDPVGERPQRWFPIFTGSNDEAHDFGYPCTMPPRIELENVCIQDRPADEAYRGPLLFGDVRFGNLDASFPYARTREVILKNVTTASGIPLQISEKPELFTDCKVVVAS